MKMNRKNYCGALVILGFISSIFATPTTITSPPFSDNIVVPRERDDLQKIFGHCLHKKDVSKCLKNRMIDVIDDVIQSDDPLSVNLFNINMSLNKNPQFKEIAVAADESRSFEDVLSQKLKALLESRVVQMKLFDDADEAPEVSSNVNEARKKKGGGSGGKHGMMMSGMALMAFLAQLFLSKVAFMSGAALLLAKIALLFSTLTSLKKSSGSGGGEHVVYQADAKQGWQRSIHTMAPNAQQQQQQGIDDLQYRGHSTMPSYDGV